MRSVRTGVGTDKTASAKDIEREGYGAEVSVVIVHFETPDLLERCLSAIAAQSGAARIETFVVDNASRTFDHLAVERRLPGVHLIVNERNAGFAVAANQGLSLAAERYLLLINADTLVAPDTLAAMVSYMDERPKVGCATARLVMEDGRLDLACRRSFPTAVLPCELFEGNRNSGSQRRNVWLTAVL